MDNGKNEIFETIKESQEETIRLEAKDIAELKVGQSQKVFSFWFHPQKKTTPNQITIPQLFNLPQKVDGQ